MTTPEEEYECQCECRCIEKYERKARREARRFAYEQAAKVAEDRILPDVRPNETGNVVAREIAAAIRSLSSEGE